MQKHLDGYARAAVNAFAQLLRQRQISYANCSPFAKVKDNLALQTTLSSSVVPNFTMTAHYKAFDLPNCKLNHTLLPDGSKKIVQTAADFSVRVLLKRNDGSMEEKVFDRYGRTVFDKQVEANGDWISSEWSYFDSEGKISPFLSAKRITTSDGILKEVTYGQGVKIKGQCERMSQSSFFEPDCKL
jgi:hypothetical protein